MDGDKIGKEATVRKEGEANKIHEIFCLTKNDSLVAIILFFVGLKTIEEYWMPNFSIAKGSHNGDYNRSSCRIRSEDQLCKPCPIKSL